VKRRKWKLRVGTAIFWYDRRRFIDREISGEVSVKGVSGGTLLGGVRNIVRYDKNNSQFYSEFYRGLGKGFWGYAGFDVSPEATFLPQISLRGGVFKTFSVFELGTSLSYLKFKDSEVYLVIPTIILYLPRSIFYSGRVYYSILSQTYTFHNRIYEREGRFRWFFNLSFGTSSERLQAGEDFFKYRTFSAGTGVEYFIDRGFGLGVNLKYEDREGLYRRYGGEFYVRIAW